MNEKKKYRKTFLMYTEWESLVLAMNDEEAGELIKAVFCYQTDRLVYISKEKVRPVFEMMKIRFERDNEE